MAWKRLLMEGDAAVLSDATPQAVDGSAGSAGTGTKAARDDHVHPLGPLVANLDFNLKEAEQHVIEKRADWPTYVGSEGQVIYYTNDNSLYVYVV